MNAEVFKYSLTILERHLDTFGHVNNATYLELYEEARWDFCTKNNYGMKDIFELQKGPVILNIDISFRAELLNREDVIIESKYTGMKNKYAMLIEQKMIKSCGKIASEITLEVGLMDLKLRKLMEPNSDWLRAVGMKDL